MNARHVKQVLGRKTDVCDSEWLAELGRCGLLRPSFIPPRDLRELRLLSRYRRKVSGILAGEKNRLHKVLDDAGIRLGCVVSDIDGVSARAMVESLIQGGSTPEQTAERFDPVLNGWLRFSNDIAALIDGHVQTGSITGPIPAWGCHSLTVTSIAISRVMSHTPRTGWI